MTLSFMQKLQNAQAFQHRYTFLYKQARLGSGTRRAYWFIATSLQQTQDIQSTIDRVEAYLVALGREANSRFRPRQAFAIDQIAILEHFVSSAQPYA